MYGRRTHVYAPVCTYVYARTSVYPGWVIYGSVVSVTATIIDGLAKVHRGEFFIYNLLVLINFIIAMIRWTGLAPWDFQFPFSGSLTSTFLILLRYVYTYTGAVHTYIYARTCIYTG